MQDDQKANGLTNKAISDSFTGDADVRGDVVSPPVVPPPVRPVYQETEDLTVSENVKNVLDMSDNGVLKQTESSVAKVEQPNNFIPENQTINTIENSVDDEQRARPDGAATESIKEEVVAAPVIPAPIIPAFMREETEEVSVDEGNRSVQADVTVPASEEPASPVISSVEQTEEPVSTIQKTGGVSSFIPAFMRGKRQEAAAGVIKLGIPATDKSGQLPQDILKEAIEENNKPVENGSSEKQEDSVEKKEQVDYKSANFLKELFANGNECVTAPGGSFPAKDDTRALLVLFSNGRFFVSESAQFDGKVLGFQYLARKRRLQIGKPEYVPNIVINDIYEYAQRNKHSSAPEVENEDQQEARMQRDYVTIVSLAAAERVSDIHIVVAEHSTVFFRVNGVMQVMMEYTKEWGESFVRSAFASSDVSDSNYAQNEYQSAQKSGRTPLRGSGGRLVLPRSVMGIRLQFNPIAFGTRYLIMRLLYDEDSSRTATGLSSLGFSKKEEDIFYQLRAMPTGIVIISGPTGSGKSTTLQRNMISMIQERNNEINLITVEDPPEYPILGARQMPVTNASIEEAKDREFTKALSAALRSDPDALMIGEIRTLSAADLAFRGALSGHNVWTTLHANSAPAVLMRLKDMGVEDFKLQDPDIMKGMLAQRLFRKVCPYCRIPAKEKLNHPAVQRLYRAFGDAGLEYAYLRGPGCQECNFRGVKGRTVVAEFVIPDATFLDLMIRGESKKALNYWINDLGGTTLRESALSRMLTGVIDIEEVERWTGFLDQQTVG